MYLIAEPEPGSKLRLRLFIEPRRVDRAYGRLYNDLSDRGDIPGFRKGKVPVWRIRRQYGEDVVDGAVFADALESALGGLMLYAALEPTAPLDFGDDEERKAVQGQPIEIEATVAVRPAPRLPDYGGIEAEVPEVEPTDEQVDQEIERLRETAAELTPVEDREVRKGDLVEVTLRTRVGDDPEADEQQEAFVVGEDRYDPAIDAHLLGHRIGETVKFGVDYPGRPTMGRLAGQHVEMEAEIEAISERQLPELNDEFAAQAAEASSVEELRRKVAEQLRESNQRLADTVLRTEVARWLLDNVPLDLPPELLARGESLEREADEEDEEQLEALRAVKLQLLCEAVLRERRATVTEEEVRQEYVEAGERHGLDPEELRDDEIESDVEYILRERVLRRKALGLVAEGATAKPVPMSEFLKRAESEEESAVEAEEAGEAEATDPPEEPTEEQAQDE